MREINEELLEAWLQLTSSINKDKIVSNLPFNETLICRILYQNKGKEITATDLCALTKMQKSQMNRTLTSMEDKNLIHRERSKKDKRQIFVILNEKQEKLYKDQHDNILKLIDKLVDRVGMDKAKKTLELFKLISHIAKEEIE